MLLVCPRCSGSLQPDARACPRCGLVLSGAASTAAEVQPGLAPANGREFEYVPSPSPEPVVQTSQVEYVSQEAPQSGGTSPYVPAEVPAQVPVRPRGRNAPAYTTGVTDTPTASASLLVPRGAVEMLPNESVVFQLGALYLTNKRVILLAPSVVRAAFLRDVDAIGTLSERASGWSFFFGLILLGLAGSGLYFTIARAQFEETLPTLYVINPLIVAVGLGLLAIYLLVNYFFWVKRTLFLSVGGRPLITVSITDWNARKLEGMDAFINTFSQVKDAVHSGEQ
jgi:hypothetical protein